MKRITLLGSTGSIGVTTLKVVKAHSERFSIVCLGAGKNIRLLVQQILSFKPKVVCVQDRQSAQDLMEALPAQDKPRVLWGTDGFVEISTLEETDTVVSAMTGAAGLVPTYEAIKASKEIALANKETMVMAGRLIMKEARRRGVSVIPIDSEHSAVLQCLQGHNKKDVLRIILTASGGPFHQLDTDNLSQVTPSDALDHPNWEMGPKVTIDSATLMNKGLEVIEAQWLFDIPLERIKILIHPQSIVHSMVEYRDGSVIAQMGIPDMTIPISYALSYPHHLENSLPPLDLTKVGPLTFQEPDFKKFKCLSLALEAAKIGGSMPTVLNASNEVAVEAFLKRKISFLDIPRIISNTMSSHHMEGVDTIEGILEVDAWARKKASTLVKQA